MSNSLMGAGGCLRDDSGIWLVGYLKFIGMGDSLQAEFWVIILGLNLTSQLPYISKVITETNSNQAAELLLHSTFGFHPLGTIVENYRLLLSSFEDYKISKRGRIAKYMCRYLSKGG